MCRLGALLLLTFVATAQAQQTTLTLACKGTTTAPMVPDEKPQPISMGIVVNFGTRTVQVVPEFEFPIMITAANDVMVAFSGEQILPSSVRIIFGSIDRVTGDVEATSSITDPKTSKSISQTDYALQCKPTQRMF